jgi:hypothetical protein
VRVTSVRVQVHARVTSVSLVSVSVSVVVYCMSRQWLVWSVCVMRSGLSRGAAPLEEYEGGLSPLSR